MTVKNLARRQYVHQEEQVGVPKLGVPQHQILTAGTFGMTTFCSDDRLWVHTALEPINLPTYDLWSHQHCQLDNLIK